MRKHPTTAPVNSFRSRSITEEEGSSTEFICSVELPKLCGTPCYPNRRRSRGHNFPPPAGNYVFLPRYVGTIALWGLSSFYVSCAARNRTKSRIIKNNAAGNTTNIRGLACHAPTGSSRTSWMNAEVRPQPGHDTPKTVFHRQGRQMSTGVKDLRPADTRK
jgi:hypothetical protein